MSPNNCDECGYDKNMCECKSTYVAQEGGDHYQAEYQHWDWVADIEMGYLPGNATKYVSRWWKKNGVADLRKAMTYIDKMIAIRNARPDYKFNREQSYKTKVYTERFVASNNLPYNEADFCWTLVGPCSIGFLMLAKKRLETIIETAVRAAQRGQPAAAPTLPATPALAPAGGAGGAAGGAGGATGQGAASGASVEVARSRNRTGIEHPSPFGYDE
jgi:hypothetical protein